MGPRGVTARSQIETRGAIFSPPICAPRAGSKVHYQSRSRPLPSRVFRRICASRSSDSSLGAGLLRIRIGPPEGRTRWANPQRRVGCVEVMPRYRWHRDATRRSSLPRHAIASPLGCRRHAGGGGELRRRASGGSPPSSRPGRRGISIARLPVAFDAAYRRLRAKVKPPGHCWAAAVTSQTSLTVRWVGTRCS